jgi:NTE family protein
MTTAFVLSGGGSLGAIQVGMLKALYEREIAPDLIVGTSVGAINGAFIASRPTTVDTVDQLGEIWRGMRRSKVFPIQPLTGLLGFLGRKRNLVPNRGLRTLIRRHAEFSRLEDAPIPLHVIATDVFSGKERRLSVGSLVDAVMASAALPAVFPPITWEGTELFDGGVSNNTPISDAIELGAERIYVLPTGNACDLERPPRGALAMLLHALTLLVMRRLIMEIELLKDEAELVVLPPPCPLRVSPADFGRARELIERGYEDCLPFLDTVVTGEGQVPLSMTMHGHPTAETGAIPG